MQRCDGVALLVAEYRVDSGLVSHGTKLPHGLEDDDEGEHAGDDGEETGARDDMLVGEREEREEDGGEDADDEADAARDEGRAAAVERHVEPAEEREGEDGNGDAAAKEPAHALHRSAWARDEAEPRRK